MCFFFKKKINKSLLKLSKIAYGGEFYYSLREYALKEIAITNPKFKKTQDSLLKKIGNTSFYSYKNENSGFVATLFEQTKTKEIVIAYRGTERIGLGENYADLTALGKDIKTDINIIAGNPDEQFEDAYDFYLMVKEQCPKTSITLVGQSLGGALAQIVGAKIYNNTGKKIQTYSYNAPGCKHLLEILGCDTGLDYSFITNYSVMNDWCGMFGEKIGTTYLLPPIPSKKTEDASAKDIFENVLLTSHEGIFNYSGKVIQKPKTFNQAEGLSLWYFDLNNPIKDFDSPSEFISTYVSKFNMPQLNSVGKSIQNKIENFLEEQNEKFQEISSKIPAATIDFLDEQKDKITDILTNNTLNQISEFLDNTFSEITIESLENALKTLKSLKIHKSQPTYYDGLKNYLINNQ